MNWSAIFDRLAGSGLADWARRLSEQSPQWLVGHGDYARWRAALDALPDIAGANGVFDRNAVSVEGDSTDSPALEQALRGLMPWRKGPFQFADVTIDCEWRSDFKWQRVSPHLAPLKHRRILDIGCGNGYYAWRMLEQEPALVLGIEPSVLFNLQFQAVQRYLQRDDIHVLPIGIENMPENMAWFDSVFSMGVLYHRRSPIDHLYQLRDFLVSGGELCLETLVIEGGAGQVLLPEGRYARMRNVWFIPSTEELLRWLQRCGFVDVRLVDESTTSIEEQRSTPWMQFESLPQALDPDNPEITVEGLPAPRRAVVIANKP